MAHQSSIRCCSRLLHSFVAVAAAVAVLLCCPVIFDLLPVWQYIHPSYSTVYTNTLHVPLGHRMTTMTRGAGARWPLSDSTRLASNRLESSQLDCNSTTRSETLLLLPLRPSTPLFALDPSSNLLRTPLLCAVPSGVGGGKFPRAACC